MFSFLNNHFQSVQYKERLWNTEMWSSWSVFFLIICDPELWTQAGFAPDDEKKKKKKQQFLNFDQMRFKVVVVQLFMPHINHAVVTAKRQQSPWWFFFSPLRICMNITMKCFYVSHYKHTPLRSPTWNEGEARSVSLFLLVLSRLF